MPIAGCRKASIDPGRVNIQSETNDISPILPPHTINQWFFSTPASETVVYALLRTGCGVTYPLPPGLEKGLPLGISGIALGTD